MIVPLWKLIFVALVVSVDSYRILGIFPIKSRSHWSMYNTIMKELARRGHQVDVISPYQLEEPIGNYTAILMRKELTNELENSVTIESVEHDNPITMVSSIAIAVGNEPCEQLKHQPFKDFLRKMPKDSYDMVITEVLAASCYLAFGHHFDVPTVALISSVISPWANDMMGNEDNPSYIPNYLLWYSENMNFWQRLVNTVFTRYSKVGFNLGTRRQDEILRETFGPDVPGVRDLERRIDLHLVNSYFSLNGVRPFTPAVVEVGGLHIGEDKEALSPELMKWLDDSSHGVVYFSIGSMMRVETFSRKVLLSFYASFAKLAPIRVLWKAPKELLPEGLPKNILTVKWTQQRLVLMHKNVRAFITHGGLLSTQEAISAGVPLIGIALCGEQPLNIQTYVNKRIAVSIEKHEITEQALDTALHLVLYDPMYRKNARRIGNLFKDRQMPPLDTAVWWIEYIGRHGKGALRSPALDLTWWQIALLDVYGFIIFSTILAFYFLKLVAKKVFNVLMSYFEHKSKKNR